MLGASGSVWSCRFVLFGHDHRALLNHIKINFEKRLLFGCFMFLVFVFSVYIHILCSSVGVLYVVFAVILLFFYINYILTLYIYWYKNQDTLWLIFFGEICVSQTILLIYIFEFAYKICIIVLAILAILAFLVYFMQIYNIISIIKILVWIFTICLVWFRVSPISDLGIWVSLMLVWLFLVLRWVWFWIAYFVYLVISHKKLSIIASQSYKISFLFGIYGLINFLMIAYEIRKPMIWIAITWFFVWISILMFRAINYKFDNIWSASTISSQDI